MLFRCGFDATGSSGSLPEDRKGRASERLCSDTNNSGPQRPYAGPNPPSWPLTWRAQTPRMGWALEPSARRDPATQGRTSGAFSGPTPWSRANVSIWSQKYWACAGGHHAMRMGMNQIHRPRPPCAEMCEGGPSLEDHRSSKAGSPQTGVCNWQALGRVIFVAEHQQRPARPAPSPLPPHTWTYSSRTPSSVTPAQPAAVSAAA